MDTGILDRINGRLVATWVKSVAVSRVYPCLAKSEWPGKSFGQNTLALPVTPTAGTKYEMPKLKLLLLLVAV